MTLPWQRIAWEKAGQPKYWSITLPVFQCNDPRMHIAHVWSEHTEHVWCPGQQLPFFL